MRSVVYSATALLAIFLATAVPAALSWLLVIVPQELGGSLPGAAALLVMGVAFGWPYAIVVIAAYWRRGLGLLLALSGEVVGFMVALGYHSAISLRLDPAVDVWTSAENGTCGMGWAMLTAPAVVAGIIGWFLAIDRERQPRRPLPPPALQG